MLHTARTAPLQHLQAAQTTPQQQQHLSPPQGPHSPPDPHSAPASTQQHKPTSTAPRTQSPAPEQQLARIRKFKGLVNDPLRPYQRDIILHLLFSPDVPETARRIYGNMKANTLQETIRARVKAQGELARCLQATSHQHGMLARWHRNALNKQQLNLAAIKQEEDIILRIKTRLGGVRSKVQKLMALSKNMADTEYQQYAAQHLDTVAALEEWLGACRHEYYPWMRRMLRINSDYARRVGIMGECEDLDRRWEEDMRGVPELTLREVPEVTYALRYPPQGTVRPRLGEEQLLRRIKVGQDDPEQVAAALLVERPPVWALPGPEEVDDPADLVLPGAFE